MNHYSESLLSKKILFITAASTNTPIKTRIGKYISGSLINSVQDIELFLTIKFPSPAPNEFTINIPGTKPNKVEKKYFFIFILKITGKTFWIANGSPPPVNLNNVKYKKSFLLNKLTNFSTFLDNLLLIY